MLADRVRMGSGDMPVNLILYQAGDTGDNWIVREKGDNNVGTVTFGGSHLEWNGVPREYDALYHKSPIDLSKYSYLELEFSSYNQSRITTRYDIQNINKKLYIEVFMGISVPTAHYAKIVITGWSHPSDFKGEYDMLYLGSKTGEIGWVAYESKDKPPMNEALSQYIYRIELIK